MFLSLNLFELINSFFPVHSARFGQLRAVIAIVLFLESFSTIAYSIPLISNDNYYHLVYLDSGLCSYVENSNTRLILLR
ncbi:MAG TPA: hypothetical protein DER18_17530 [Shewanella baltica]|nr:hypothetical protein [Shewanella baltica]